MTARDLYKKAMTLLGYTVTSGEISGEQEYLKKGMAAVNQIYTDLFYIAGKGEYSPVEHSSDRVDLPEKVLNDVMPYGVAMFIAQSESDGDSQRLFAEIYAKKRASIRCGGEIKDVLPR